MGKVSTFLMFQGGQAEEAINFYTSLIRDSAISSISRYGKGESGDEGTVMKAMFSLKGQEFMCIDSNVSHQFNFTPSFSIYIDCDTEQEIRYLYENLAKDGQLLMPLDDYGFSQQFGWVQDRFGVSWQMDLPKE
ncbi:VOC family protein [Sporosarcina sp. A2]|uniref:VOC family protein n=1 Tax=Sporosarcina sp. A2 TaxID=3393449 RepID=UPI003D7A4F99